MNFTTERLFLKRLTASDVTNQYVNWLNDPLVNKYLETRHQTQTYESCCEYVSKIEQSDEHYLFGIFQSNENIHIGNIKLGFINNHHSRAQMSLFLGEKEAWGKGYASEAIKKLTLWGISELNLQRIEAGCCEENIGSLKAFLNSGYRIEGYFRNAVQLINHRAGSYWMAIISDDLHED